MYSNGNRFHLSNGTAKMCWVDVKVQGNTPTIKNHTATLVNNTLLVFGGYDGRRNHNTIHELDCDTFEWRQITEVHGTPPDGRNGHTATLAKGKIWIIGGWLGAGPLAASDLHVLSLDTMTWESPETSGKSPGPCNMHSTDYIEHRNQLFVFRGGDGRAYLNDLHALDIDKLVWTQPKVHGRLPLPRANHSSAVVGNKLYIFGGWDGQKRLNDIHVLDTETMMWTELLPKGNLPFPRAGMTLSCVRDRIFLFGGSGQQAKCFNDLQVYDPETNTWLETCTAENSSVGYHNYLNEDMQSDQGNAERTRGRGYSMGVSNGNSASFGGRSQLMRDMSEGKVPQSGAEKQWHMSSGQGNPNSEPDQADIVVLGNGPGCRAGHTTTLYGRKLIVFGGSFGNDYLSDFHELDTDPPPSVRVPHMSTVDLFQGSLVKFLNSEEFSDVTFIVEGRKLYAHRVVLSLLSERFRAMFGAGFLESKEREIVITDIRYSVFSMLLEYLYTGLVPNMEIIQSELPRTNYEHCLMGSGDVDMESDEVEQEQNIDVVIELLQAADQFMLDHLKQVCESMLQLTVNSDTVHILLEEAERNNALQLRDVCLHYLRNHHRKHKHSFSNSEIDDESVDDLVDREEAKRSHAPREEKRA